jgi:hypothetical protein
MPPHGIEVVWVSAAEVGAAVLIFFVLVGVAFAAGAWAMRGPDVTEQPEQSVTAELVEDPNRTVEIKRGPRRPPRTGTIHAAHLAPDESPTEVIRRPGGMSS